MLKTNVDRVLEMLNVGAPVALKDISQKLGILEETLEKIAKYLEEEGILKLDYHLVKPYVILAKPLAAMQEDEDVPEAAAKSEDTVNKGLEGAERRNYENFEKIIELMEGYIKKKDFLNAGQAYMQAFRLFGSEAQFHINKNMYEKLAKAYSILIKSQFWTERTK